MMATKGIQHWADILVVVIYFLLIFAIGVWTLFRPNRGNVRSYFLAGGSMLWFPVGASLFGSNIGAEHFVGLAGTGAAAGISIILYEWLPGLLIVGLGWLFLPVYMSAGVFTLPEYLQKRFGGRRIRTYISIFSLVIYIITKLAVTIFSGVIYLQLSLGWNMYASIVALLVITGIYTSLGGLAAVMYTDAAQCVIMMLGALFVVGYGFDAIGGYENLEGRYFEAIASVRDSNSSCGLPRDDAFHLFRDPVNSDNPWPGFLLQASVGCIWYWCCDQVIVQRAMAAKNLSHAKGGALMAAILKIFPMFLMVMPGMISRSLFPDEVGCIDPEVCREVCDNPVGCSNIAYPKLVMELLPVGLRGLLLAVMLSAIMSSLTSIFNSASSIFTMDLWTQIRPRASQRELLIVGRAAVLVMCVVTVLWLPLVKSSQGGQVFIYLNAVQASLATPLGIIFLWGIVWKKTSERAAFYSIVVSHVIGLTRLIMEFVFPVPACGEPDTRPAILAKVHYTYFGVISMVIASLVLVTVTFVFKDEPQSSLEGTTWWTRRKGLTEQEQDEEKEKDEELLLNDNLARDCQTKGDNHDDVVVETDPEPTDAEEQISPWRRLVLRVCGLPSGKEEPVSSAAMTVRQIRHFLTEKARDRYILNTVACITVIVIAFLCGIYH